jgi:hypothetical protein
MIGKSGYRFSEKDHAPLKIQSAMMIQLEAIALWSDDADDWTAW